MKLLVNASNIRKSGALQVTLSFLEEIRAIREHNYHIIVSEEVERQINKDSYPDNFSFYSISLGAPFSKVFFEKRKKLQQTENTIGPDCVFSIFGPTYWTPTALHLAGFAYVWAINPDSIFIKNLPVKQFIRQKLENMFKSIYFRKDSKYFVVETEDVKRRLAKYIGINPSNIYVVNNTNNHYFNGQTSTTSESVQFGRRKPKEFRLITISSNFPHKNLAIINEVDNELKKLGRNEFFFYVTIPANDYSALFSRSDNVVNLGVVAAKDCPYIYSQCDALFLPTMLECFTASYPEAMTMKKPILTSDLGFAREICEDSAIYFDPLDPKDIATKIIRVADDKHLYERQILIGSKRVLNFPSAAGRAKKYLEICESILVKDKLYR